MLEVISALSKYQPSEPLPGKTLKESIGEIVKTPPPEDAIIVSPEDFIEIQNRKVRAEAFVHHLRSIRETLFALREQWWDIKHNTKGPEYDAYTQADDIKMELIIKKGREMEDFITVKLGDEPLTGYSDK